MQLIRGQHNFSRAPQPCVATIGNFDGLHRGHQAVLQQVADTAKQLSLPLTVISFEPLPREYFKPDSAPTRLMAFRDKFLALNQLGVDRWVLLNFNAELAALSAAEFVQRILLEGLNVRHLVVGDDFRFGRGREGDFALLERLGDDHGFTVAATETLREDAERVSSTRVRDALKQGDMALAEKLLGRAYSMSGRVAHGDKRGRTIGFPTANIRIKHQRTPLRGVFAVRVHGITETPLQGVANLGRRPTVNGIDERLEVHVFDFDGDVYGKHLKVELLQRLRDEQKFNGLDELVAQIQCDAQTARNFFANT